ncbi:hypothetical protein V6N13_038314 [Hibiscus sabdariffa]
MAIRVPKTPKRRRQRQQLTRRRAATKRSYMDSSRKAHPNGDRYTNGDEGYGVGSSNQQPYSNSYRRGSIHELMRRLRSMVVTTTDDW